MRARQDSSAKSSIGVFVQVASCDCSAIIRLGDLLVGIRLDLSVGQKAWLALVEANLPIKVVLVSCEKFVTVIRF